MGPTVWWLNTVIEKRLWPDLYQSSKARTIEISGSFARFSTTCTTLDSQLISTSKNIEQIQHKSAGPSLKGLYIVLLYLCASAQLVQFCIARKYVAAERFRPSLALPYSHWRAYTHTHTHMPQFVCQAAYCAGIYEATNGHSCTLHEFDSQMIGKSGKRAPTPPPLVWLVRACVYVCVCVFVRCTRTNPTGVMFMLSLLCCTAPH